MTVKKLMIIDVDALLGIHNALGHPRCLRSACDKSESFLGENHRCLRRKWCASASYDPNGILEYRSESNVTADNCYTAVLPALEKLAESNWLISFWTTRPKRQTVHIIRTLRETGIWKMAQMVAGTPLLLNNSVLPDNGAFSPATEKLALFERVYGKLGDRGWWLAAIEADPLEASIFQSYVGSQVTVHISPRTWLEILMIDLEDIDNLLWAGSKEIGAIAVNMAS